ncbi:GAP1-N2 domain-containing protein [Herbidospora mongoliensis]|uniref:GAP1-N2 domain-containing protein n=1 Tax=Herbidospora mongoliensis TaxID=688067 RepID=UPI00083101A1|nr:hypothetical protein [Herbidospora mongoliensis]
MAWQLQYTSAESGPTGRAGFQVTAETPGLPPVLRERSLPFLVYQPPPDASSSEMPVSMAYGREVLARCVYLGQDYSGRYGNFLGHAVLLGEGDLVGLRPIEFWGASWWADQPVPGDLPSLEPSPGPFLDPESLVAWLASLGPDAFVRLGGLLESVRLFLTRGHGRLVLISPDVSEIVRWIAVISFSLPWASAIRVSFVTYTGDPASSGQVIAGTTPDVWIPPDIDATVIRLDEPPAPVRTGRFAGTVAGFWRRGDLDGLDALGELGDDPETAAALLALCRGDHTVSPEEQLAIAGLAADGLPDWAWRRLGSQAALLTHDLASVVAVHAVEGAARCVSLALRDPALPLPVRLPPPGYASALGAEATAVLRSALTPAQVSGVARVADACALPVDPAEVESAAARTIPGNQEEAVAELSRVPSGWREPMIAGYVAGLEAAPGEISPTLCGLLAGSPRDWRRAPRTGVRVLGWQNAHGGRDRVDVTVELMDQAFGVFREQVLPGMWTGQPLPGEISRLVDLLGPRIDASPTLGELPGRAFVKAGLADGAVLDLAERVRDGLPGFPADDAEATLIAARLPSAPTPVEAAIAIDRLTELTREGNADLAVLTRTTAAKVLSTRDPRFRSAVAKAVTDATRRWLIPEWLKPRRTRDQRMALLEIAIRMRAAGVIEPRLDAWARSEINNWGPFSSVEARFKQDAELAAGLRELAGQRRRLFGRGDR